MRERNLRAIQGLMDDVAKADVVGVRGMEEENEEDEEDEEEGLEGGPES